MNEEKCTAIVLAAGQGSRMGTNIQKQYLDLNHHPVIYYSLAVFQEEELIDDIILVVGKGQQVYCKEEIVEHYQLSKVRTIVEGGSERYHSVWNGLKCIPHNGYVFIHDGARPFVTHDMLQRVYESVKVNGACVIGMPVKDTIKIVDQNRIAKNTPNRNLLWTIQTPQVFAVSLIKRAYSNFMQQSETQVTDDAMVVELMGNQEITLVEGSYENIKITTPEDLDIAEVFLQRKNKKNQKTY